MADAEDGELLAPSYVAASAARLVGFPRFSTERAPSPVPRLKVVYDRHFDRFFLRVEIDATEGTTPRSQRPMSPAKSKAKRKGSIVQWEDLLLPPRSVVKPSAAPDMNTHEEGTATDTESQGVRGHENASIGGSSVPQLDAQSSQEPTAPPIELPKPARGQELTLSSGVEPRSSDPMREPSAKSATHTTESGCVGLQPSTRWSTLEAAVLVFRSLRRYIRHRRNNVSPSQSAQQEQSPPPSAAMTTVPPEETSRDPAVALQEELRLDLTRLALGPMHGQGRSPGRSSPKKWGRRVPGTSIGGKSYYERHFANAMAGQALPVGLNSIQDHDEQEIRWQGEVIHVSIDPPRPTLDLRVPTQRRERCACIHGEQRQAMTHVYDLQELVRIRPKPDGFRRVNDACAFTELTSSSSSSSESEQEELPEVSSSEEEDQDPHQEFKRGDRVLFYARHRWFKGTVLRRIKQSWFYDVKADNGSFIEAVVARRMRLFEDEDDEPEQQEFEQGDLVLWVPRTAPQDGGRRNATQTYKARVTSIRRTESAPFRAKRAQRPRGHEHRAYDLELRTGRIVKRVAHAQLRPLYQYRHRS